MIGQLRGIVVGTCSLAIGCSLLAPNDSYFLDGSGGAAGGGAGGGNESVCVAAPACDQETPGPTVDVMPSQVEALPGLVASADPGTTFLLQPGDYALTAVISIKTRGITLASSTGIASDVVIDGGGAAVMISISADDVTLRDLTLRNAKESAVLVGGGTGDTIEHPRLCGVTIEDGGSAFVRTSRETGWVDCGRVEGSTFSFSDQGRSARCSEGLVSAIAVSGGRGWSLVDDLFQDFYCSATEPTSPADCVSSSPPIGVIFSLGARDTLIERSRFFGVSRAVALGYTITTTAPRTYADAPYEGMTVDHYDGIVRNNLIVGHRHCFDTGIELNHARRPALLHNTVVYPEAIAFSPIDRRYPATEVEFANNLIRGTLTFRDGAPKGNDQATVTVDALDALFVDPVALDFHLRPDAASAIDRGVANDRAGLDLDGETHDVGTAPDVGADERSP